MYEGIKETFTSEKEMNDNMYYFREDFPMVEETKEEVVKEEEQKKEEEYKEQFIS